MKEIEGYEGLYAVTEDGKVLSLERIDPLGRHKKAFYLKQDFKVSRYCHVRLCKNTVIKNYDVHRLVAQAYIPNPDNYPQINHKNGIKKDNRVENLEWCTSQQNIIHAWETSLNRHRKGIESATHKLNESQVIEIRKIYEHKKSIKWQQMLDTASKFGVTGSCIYSIVHRKTWQHI